jgi:integral membrane protein
MDKIFRITGWLEGGSYLLLLLVAMPLKYIWGEPGMVRVVGMAHGLLFVAYIGVAFAMYDKHDWPLRKLVWAVIASFLPFGPFLFEAKMLQRPA